MVPVLLEDELYHYGVLGMKWGVRHDNRKSGSPSSRGSKKKGGAAAKARKASNRAKATRQAKARARDISNNRWNVSDKTLDRQIKRLQKQKQLRELTDEEAKPVRKETKKILKEVAKIAGTAAASAAVAIAIDRTLGQSKNDVIKEFGEDVAKGVKNRQGLGGKKNK